MSTEATEAELESRLRSSYALDELWGETMGRLAGDTKERPLKTVAEILETERVPYALIGGVAVQLHSREPRTTLDIDLAVRTFAEIPREALLRAGFEYEGRFPHSDNWRAPGLAPRAQRTAIQFSAEDVGIDSAVTGARSVDVDGFRLRIASPPDLLVLKLAAAEEPRGRPGKRRQDLLDVVTLAEEYPEAAKVIPALKERVAQLTTTILTLHLDVNVGERDAGPER